MICFSESTLNHVLWRFSNMAYHFLFFPKTHAHNNKKLTFQQSWIENSAEKQKTKQWNGMAILLPYADTMLVFAGKVWSICRHLTGFEKRFSSSSLYDLTRMLKPKVTLHFLSKILFKWTLTSFFNQIHSERVCQSSARGRPNGLQKRRLALIKRSVLAEN